MASRSVIGNLVRPQASRAPNETYDFAKGAERWTAVRLSRLRPIVAQPAREPVLIDSAGRYLENNCGGVLRRHVEIDPIEPEKHDHGAEGGPLVAVDEGMIARDSERIGGSERGKIGLPIGEFVERPRERGFEEPQIAYSIAAAKYGELLSMNIKDDISVEPFRLGHFANALYVSAYLRNDRRAISMA